MMSSTSNDEVRRKMEKPVVDIALAIEVCGRVFFPTTPASDSLHIVECEPLESYDDCNFAIRVSAPPNTWYTLKFHNGVESDNLPFLTAQDNLLKDLDPYLRAHELQVPQPQGQTSSIHLIPNVPMSGGVPRSCAVRLLTWIHGSPLYRRKPQLAPEKEGLGKRRGVRNEEDNDENHDEGAPPLQGQDDDPIHLEAGRCLAVLSQSLDQISRRKTETRFEAFHRHHEWDLTNFLEIRPMIQYVQEAWVIEQVLAEFEATIDYTTVRHRICQSDFNDGNLICSADERDKIAGIIDFGDTVYTATVNEIAIALAYMMLTCVHAPVRLIRMKAF